MSEHVLKVQPPYFDALLDGSKTFEVRRNDRAYQRGDTLVLWEFGADKYGRANDCKRWDCADCKHRHVRREVTFVYAGDPRFGGIEPGHVVLAITPTPTQAHATTEPTHPPHDPAASAAEEEASDG